MYQIAIDYPESIEADPGKPVAVLRVEGEITGLVEAFATVEDAADAVRGLIAADEAAAVAAEESVATANIELRVQGMAELERAAELMDRIAARMNGSTAVNLATVTSVVAEFAALPPHSTEVTEDDFDWEANKMNVAPMSEEGANYYGAIYAWVDPEGDPNMAESYEMMHHFVGADGTPGAASFGAIMDKLSKLNGIREIESEDLPGVESESVRMNVDGVAFSHTIYNEEDRRRVYDHLIGHLVDGGYTEFPTLIPQDVYEDLMKQHEIAEAVDEIGEAVDEIKEILMPEETPSMEANVDVRVQGLEELERAAALADRIADRLSGITIGSAFGATDVPVADVATEESVEMAEAHIAEFAGVPIHSTEVITDPFDAEAALAMVTPEMEDGAGYYEAIFAWVDPESDPNMADAYYFIHHFVNEAGEPGAASSEALLMTVDMLNGVGPVDEPLTEEDRQGVYDHVAAHAADGGVEIAALIPQAEYEGIVGVPGEEEEPSDEVEIEMTEEKPSSFTAIRSHSTGTSDDAWDGAANEVNVRSPESEDYFANVYAWRDDEADTSVKAAYRFIHHFVAEDGRAGAASMTACSTGIGVLNGGRGGTTIPAADREGVYNHLAAHLRDADREPPALMSQADYEAALAEANKQLAAEAEAGTDVSALPDEVLLAELARRWADDTAKEIKSAGEGLAENAGDTAAAETPVELGADDEPVALSEPEGTVETFAPDTEFDWEAVLIVEGIPSGDGRMVLEGVLTWRDLPIPLMSQTVNAPGHDGSAIAGSIVEIERVGQEIIGRGYFDSGEAGQELRRLVNEKTMRGVSADVDSVMVEFRTPEGEEVDIESVIFGDVEALEVLVEGRIMGATATPFPAFQEAQIRILSSDKIASEEALVASGAIGDVWSVQGGGIFLPGSRPDADKGVAALVASAGSGELMVPANPPRSWFEKGEMDKPEPFTVHPDGRCYGLVAAWGSCHIGFSDKCVNVPRTGEAYKSFRNKSTLTAEGDLVATGPIFMNTVHPNLRLVASDTQAHYADTGCGVADVALYENEFGIVAAGAIRPGLSAEQVREFRGSDVSPDWRMIKGRLEIVALLSVNCSGFIVEGLVAAGGESSAARGLYDSVEGGVTALVAAGMVRHGSDEMARVELSELRAELAELREALRPIRAERAAAEMAKRGFGTSKAAAHDCGGDCGGSEGACSCEV